MFQSIFGQKEAVWRTPEELVEIGLGRSRVLMMNEAHNGMTRCIRTRQIGRQILPTAHRLGVRYLAMEALFPLYAQEANATHQLPDVSKLMAQWRTALGVPQEVQQKLAAEQQIEWKDGYLGQPDMQALVQTALELGWTLIPYESDFTKKPAGDPRSREITNWREKEQAQNLVNALRDLPAEAKMLVWCGNSHLSKRKPSDWTPMGYHLKALSGIDPFTIDQIRSVRFPYVDTNPQRQHQQNRYEEALQAQNLETAGFLADEAPDSLSWLRARDEDAYIISLHNEME